MILLIGIGLIGSHLLFLMVFAQLCSDLFPNSGLVVFLIMAVLSGLAMLHVQTRIEAFFINRHIKKRPDSGWRVVTRREEFLPLLHEKG